MIVSEGLLALDEADPATPEFGLQRPGSVALTLQSVMVPGGQVPPALAVLPPPELLAAPGPVAWLPGKAVGAGVGEVMPVVADGLAMLGEAVVVVELVVELGLALGLDTPPLALPLVLPDIPPDEVWPRAAADKPSSDAATRGKSLKVFMGWLPSCE